MNVLQELYEDATDKERLFFYRWVIERPPEGSDPKEVALSAIRALTAEELSEVLSEVL